MTNLKITPNSAFFDKDEPFSSNTKKESRPYFSFRYVCQKDYCMKNCSIEQFKKLSETLRILSSLTWKDIDTSPREQYGCEPLPQKAINATMPELVQDNEPISIFSFGRGKRGGRMAGVRRENNFYVLFIDSKYNLYNHG